MNRSTVVLFLLFLLGCNHPKQQDGTKDLPKEEKKESSFNVKKEVQDIPKIPPFVLKYMENNIPGYSLPSINDYTPIWSEFINANQLPFFAQSDFNNDGTSDYALLLRKKKSDIVTLFVICSKNKEYTHYKLSDNYLSKRGVETIISIERKGQWVGIDTTINVATDGILIELIEESLSYSYYWEIDKFVYFSAD